jgi:hypothetical protein
MAEQKFTDFAAWEKAAGTLFTVRRAQGFNHFELVDKDGSTLDDDGSPYGTWDGERGVTDLPDRAPVQKSVPKPPVVQTPVTPVVQTPVTPVLTPAGGVKP